MVAASVANYINQTVVGDVVDIPRNFVRVPFDNYPVFCLGIDDPNRCAIGIGYKGIYIGLKVVHPEFLTLAFIAGRGGVV